MEAYEKIIEQLYEYLSTPKPLLLMDRDTYAKELAESAEENFKRGMSRGQRNLIYYLSEILLGNLKMADLMIENIPDEEFKRLTVIVEHLS